MALGSTPTIMIFCDNDERWVEKYDERRKQNLWFNPGVERFLPPQKKPSCKTLTRCNAGKCALHSAHVDVWFLTYHSLFQLPTTPRGATTRHGPKSQCAIGYWMSNTRRWHSLWLSPREVTLLALESMGLRNTL